MQEFEQPLDRSVLCVGSMDGQEHHVGPVRPHKHIQGGSGQEPLRDVDRRHPATACSEGFCNLTAGVERYLALGAITTVNDGDAQGTASVQFREEGGSEFGDGPRPHTDDHIAGLGEGGHGSRE